MTLHESGWDVDWRMRLFRRQASTTRSGATRVPAAISVGVLWVSPPSSLVLARSHAKIARPFHHRSVGRQTNPPIARMAVTDSQLGNMGHRRKVYVCPAAGSVMT